MKLQEHGAPAVAWVSEAGPANSASPLASVGYFVRCVLVILEIEARKLRHDPTDMVMRLGQPVLWLLVFGQVFARVRAIPTNGLPYLDFMAPGVLAQSVLFISIFYGISAVWERDLGIVYKLLASPAPRAALVLGKALSASLRAAPLGAIVYLLAWVLGVNVDPSPLALLGVLAMIVLSATTFSTLSMIIACVVRSRERFMGIGQLITMPMFFASNAIYPIAIMPVWLQWLAHLNPLTYMVDGLRAMMLTQASSLYGLWLDFGLLALAAAILLVIAGRLYPTLGY